MPPGVMLREGRQEIQVTLGKMSSNLRQFIAIAALLFAIAPPKIGQPAPGFTLRDQSGARVSLSAARGKKVVLVFYRGYW
jgi:cytochrome oxidase Cu insertion factor (SCO1/SenC/PrrC family)